METEATTIRLTRADKKSIARIIASGVARNTSEAIRVALWEAAARRGGGQRRSDKQIEVPT